METQAGILINVDPERSARLQAWVAAIDWQIIVNQLETRSAIFAPDKRPAGGGFSFVRLTEVPEERDRYRPHYGDFGGGFVYNFRAHPSGTQIIARSSIIAAYQKESVPLGIDPAQTN